MRKLITALLMLSFLAGCAEEKKRPATALDTARTFIRATLDGKLKDAEVFLAKDSANRMLFDQYGTFYSQMDAVTREGYRNSSYVIHRFEEVNDSLVVVNYSNSFMKKPMDLKVRRTGAEWEVDFTL